MPLVPRSALLSRAVKSISTTRITPRSATTRAFSSTQNKAAEHAHEDHYDPPSGWLFGVKPGEKAEKEGWEPIFIYGYCGGLVLAAIAYAFKPDTS